MIRARHMKKTLQTKEEIVDPVLEEQERMEVWKMVLERQILLHHSQIKVQTKNSHRILNKNKRVRNGCQYLSECILYFPQLSVENLYGQIETVNLIPKRQPATRIRREDEDEEEDFAAVGHSAPFFLRPQRVYPAYFVQWEWKTSYSGGILKLSMRQ